MRNSVTRALRGILVLAVVWPAGAAADVVSDWATLSGGLTAKVVYWRNGWICKLDLTTGVETQIVNEAVAGRGIVQNTTGSGPYPCWSPDGTRILFFNIDNDWAHWVMYEDGSQLKALGPADVEGYWHTNWYDNDWVVYPLGGASDWHIQIKRLDANNNVVETQTLVDFPPYGDGRSYPTASGDYVAWTDGNANVPTLGGHRSLVRNWKTGEEMEVIARNDDACNISIKNDGSGTAVYCHAMHDNATAKSYSPGIDGGTQIFRWDPLLGGAIHHLRWSQHPDYICHIDDRTLPLANQLAWVRKVPGGQEVFLGNGVWGPDVWVGGPVTTDSITVTSPDGGENWTEGDTPTVTWTSEGDVTNVRIDLSTNGGGSWTTLVASTADDGSEQITVPQVESTQCRIRVSDTDGSPSDASDGNFTIAYLDTDTDGLPDWWEQEHFSNPTAADAGIDEEPDGLDNLEEYQAGTDPHVADTDGDGLLDGEDPDPLGGASSFHGTGCGSGSAAAGLSLAIAVAWLAARLRRRETVAE